VTGLVSPDVSAIDLLDTYSTALGARPSQGTTVGAVNLQLFLERSAGSAALPRAHFGLIVGSRTLDSADLDPQDVAAGGEQGDWMFWAMQAVEPFGSPAHTYRIKSQRRLPTVGQTLWFALSNGTAVDTYQFAIATSVLLILP